MGRADSRWILTGGLGSGKSTVARMVAERGAAVVDADRIGHEILEPGGAAFGRVSSRWPSAVIDGRIDRGRLAEIVFADSAELAVLESITHPEIRRVLGERADAAAGGLVILEVSVPKVAADVEVRGWIVVDAPDDVRLERAIGRGMSEAAARARMAAQPERAAWLELADVVVVNDGSFEDLAAAVDQLWEEIAGAP